MHWAGAPEAHGRLVVVSGASTLPAAIVAGLRAAVGAFSCRGLRADDAVAARRGARPGHRADGPRMPKGAIAATVDAPQDPSLSPTRLRLAKLGQVRAITGATDGVPAAFRDRRDVRRRALSWSNPIFLMGLFILPPCMCASLTDAHTPSIVSEVSLYITWFLSISARRAAMPSMREFTLVRHPGSSGGPDPLAARRRPACDGRGDGVTARCTPVAATACPQDYAAPTPSTRRVPTQGRGIRNGPLACGCPQRPA